MFDKHDVGPFPFSLLPSAQDWQNAGFCATVQLVHVESHTVNNQITINDNININVAIAVQLTWRGDGIGR